MLEAYERICSYVVDLNERALRELPDDFRDLLLASHNATAKSAKRAAWAKPRERLG